MQIVTLKLGDFQICQNAKIKFDLKITKIYSVILRISDLGNNYIFFTFISILWITNAKTLQIPMMSIVSKKVENRQCQLNRHCK